MTHACCLLLWIGKAKSVQTNGVALFRDPDLIAVSKNAKVVQNPDGSQWVVYELDIVLNYVKKILSFWDLQLSNRVLTEYRVKDVQLGSLWFAKTWYLYPKGSSDLLKQIDLETIWQVIRGTSKILKHIARIFPQAGYQESKLPKDWWEQHVWPRQLVEYEEIERRKRAEGD